MSFVSQPTLLFKVLDGPIGPFRLYRALLLRFILPRDQLQRSESREGFMTACVDCGGEPSWDGDVCLMICTSCGTLQDPTQSVLSSHLEQQDSSRQRDSLWNPSYSAPLKSGRSGWNLAGQAKEVYKQKNMHAMQEFIKTISCRLANPGLTPRAVAIFTQAMNTGQYHWGRKAKLTAAASVAIALRELHKPDSIRDISFLIDDSLKSIERAFMRVVNLLNLEIPSLDPALHLISLQSHLHTLINPPEGPSPLPPALLKVLKPLSLPTVIQTATSLAVLSHRLTSSLSTSPMPPTLCAFLMLALEAEIRTSLPHLGELAQLLGTRFGFAKGIVMSRYKTVYDLVEEWVREVPWLDQFSIDEKGRSKLSKRIIVARGVKDVVQFQEEIWRRKVEARGKLDVEINVDDDDCRRDDETFSSATGSSSSRSKRGPHEVGMPDRRKRHKSEHQGLDEASRFLINPLHSSLPKFDDSHSPSNDATASTQKTPSSQTPHLPLVSYLLTSSPTSLSLSYKPTRLQLLTAERPGGVESIDDSELFGDGELEGFLRSDSEVAGLKEALGWDNTGDATDDKSAHPGERSKDVPNGKKINTDALSRVLRDEDNEPDIHNLDHLEYVEAWRPLSPGGSHPYDGMDRYDEEF